MRRLAAMGLALLLAACGSSSDNPLLKAARTALAEAQAPERPSMAAQRAAVIETVRNSGETVPVLLLELPQRKAVASMIVAGQNQDALSWYDATGVSLTTREGVVIATRGLGFDLMAADMSGTLAALKGRSQDYTRSHRYLDGEGQLRTLAFTCRATRQGQTVRERCAVGDLAFTNTYVLKGHAVTRSRQWIGPGVGYADLTRLQ